MTQGLIVFSDLDGTLLDHETYSYQAACPALEAMRLRHIPLILCSSKTAAEIVPLRAALGFADCAAIVENGAGILAANCDDVTPAATHADLLGKLEELPVALRSPFRGFSSWSLQELQARTGLERAAAKLAARRDFSEPGLWTGDAATRRDFIDELARHGIRALQGGRFLTLGFDSSKARRMQTILGDYRARLSAAVISVALGDAQNDIEMLEQADFGVVIPNPSHTGLPALVGESVGHILRARQTGPAGWNTSILELIAKPDQLSRRN